jgi:hypothetical protein
MCKDCGATWQVERNAPTLEPEECPHKRTNHQGSNKYVKKTFCLDCGTYIDSVTRDLAKELSDETPWRSKEEQVLLDSVSDHEHISREQAIEAAKLMVVECEQLAEGNYTMLSIANMFLDCGDRAITASDVRMTANKRVAQRSGLDEERAAYVFTTEQREKLRGTIKAWWGLEYEDIMPDKAIPMMPERGNTSLRIVDPYEDPGVWCIVDEGANSNTHGEEWLDNEKGKWAFKGVRPVLKDATSTSFTGVGTKASSGSYMLPTGFRLKQSNLIIPGCVVSHQMPGSTHPMLLSQQAQSMLGFQKDVRDGTIRMKDYDNQDLEVVRQERTGLFMIRMDHIDIHRCAELWPYLSETKPHVDQWTMEDCLTTFRRAGRGGRNVDS